MESAIPPHLRCPRTREPRASQDYTPPYPAWVARLKPSVTQLGMGYFGVQYARADQADAAFGTLTTLQQQFASEGGPGHHDLARYVDEAGFITLVAIGYWEDAADLRRWLATPVVAHWWNDPVRTQEGLGHFREIVYPRAANLETLFSTPDCFEGVAVLAEGHSDDIQEHGYWGSARDRLPASQTDALRGSGAPTVAKRSGPRVTLHGHDGLALIRSGQEWTETSGHERDLYLQQVEPVLAKGMRFLSHEGAAIGCHLNRYMQHVDTQGHPLEKSFGLSYWRSLEHLERWSESHPTHIAIFGTFMNMVQEMNFNLKLRLYHEVAVAQAGDQLYEYVNCHPCTGMMRGVAG